MEWKDMTDRFKKKLVYAMIQYVDYGETQPIVDIVQGIQEESFLEGIQYAEDTLQAFATNEEKENE